MGDGIWCDDGSEGKRSRGMNCIFDVLAEKVDKAGRFPASLTKEGGGGRGAGFVPIVQRLSVLDQG